MLKILEVVQKELLDPQSNPPNLEPHKPHYLYCNSLILIIWGDSRAIGHFEEI